ncbi:HD-GYP domain-containing protein [Salicola sp. Rm-C-2C1-2]|uniref:HD-GYP domain-containing protein n=1 Tax=Salicola sp. Rm-C-2C1-2 TaxID=3141321 RepID=UPI0032E4B256
MSKIRIGLYVDVERPWNEHPFLFRRFRIKNRQQVEVIKRLHNETVLVFPKKSVVGKEELDDASSGASGVAETPTQEAEDALWLEKRQHLEEAKAYRNERRRLMKEYKQAAERVHRLTNDLSNAPANAMHDAETIVEDMVSHFEQGESVLMNLVNLPDGGFSTYAHSLNVTVLALSLARSLGIDRDELHQIATGALLHDCGQITLPGSIMHKKGKLTPREQKVYETHSSAGAKLAQQIGSLDDSTIRIIQDHHELLDGSGYPAGKKGDELSRATRIVSIANVYDNLCNPRDLSAARTPKETMALMYRDWRGKLDPEMLIHFIKSMGVYPPGTVVQLSDDSVALVVTVNPDNLLNPTVLLYNPDIPRNEAMMTDLAIHEELTVQGALKPKDYPERMYEYLGMTERIGYFYSKGDR